MHGLLCLQALKKHHTIFIEFSTFKFNYKWDAFSLKMLLWFYPEYKFLKKGLE